jgi:hypothetical protein
MSTVNAVNPAMKGNIIIRNITFELSPNTLRSIGLAAIRASVPGSEAFKANEISIGILPIVFDTIKTDTTIIMYLQKLFLPLNDDSR